MTETILHRICYAEINTLRQIYLYLYITLIDSRNQFKIDPNKDIYIYIYKGKERMRGMEEVVFVVVIAERLHR
jgi:hypothetical protein